MSSNSGSPFETDLHTSPYNFRLDDGNFVDMDKLDFKLLLMIDRIAIGVTQLEVVYSRFSCPCEVSFAFVVDYIDEVFNCLFLIDFWLEEFFRCNLIGFSKVSVIAVIGLLFYGHCFLFEGL